MPFTQNLRHYQSKVYSHKGSNNKNDFQAFIAFLTSIENINIEYRYPPFIFTHAQLIEAYLTEPDPLSPLSQISKHQPA